MHQCAKCAATCESDKWSRIRAHSAGWYFMKNGDVYCPNHRPEWAPKRVVSEGKDVG